MSTASGLLLHMALLLMDRVVIQVRGMATAEAFIID